MLLEGLGMARSKYIYLVYDWDTHELLGTFTVKYEALNWFQNQKVYLMRHADGDPNYEAKQV